jgi:hypothetical protein
MNASKLIAFNFHFAVWLSILGGAAALGHPDFVIPDSDGLYDPLRNNFLIIIGYLVFSQIGLWYFRYLKDGRIEALLMAYTFLATAAGAKFYGMVNNLPVSDLFVGVAAYLAFAHGLYYVAGQAQADKPADGKAGRREPDV